MGNADSTQKLGERVLVAKRKLEQDKQIQSERYAYLKANSPDMLDTMLKSVGDSFNCCSPFLDATLLVAWKHDPDACKNIMLQSCTKIFGAPILKEQYQWFKEYVFPSSIWMFRVPNDAKYMYEELLNVTRDMSQDIIESMNGIYELVQTHKKWKQVMSIKTDKDFTPVLRQDDPKVGLLKDKGFKDIFETKNDVDEKLEDMKSFIDSNCAINILTSAAKNINNEFQNHIKTVMSSYGDFKAGPMKKVERCVSKLENDYHNARYPKCSKLLDLVRCSVTFNTIDQLIKGYNGLMKHISKNNTIIELARIKNGFLPDASTGYRDIKVNVIYKSQINVSNNLNMICEIQLMLINYLQEKKRIHKLYSVLREEIYFQMTAAEPRVKKQKTNRELRDLQFVPYLDVAKEVKMKYDKTDKGGLLFGKASVDQDTDLLGIEGQDWFGVVDMKQKKIIFQTQRDSPRYFPWYARVSHAWILVNNQKYLSVQMSKTEIQMFKVVNVEQNSYKFIEDTNYRISLENNDENIINYCAFDSIFESILIVVNNSEIQKRCMQNVNNITACVKLEETIRQSSLNQLSLSFDGSLCALGGGANKNYFYLIDINQNKQYKMTSNILQDSYAPCFINGANDYVAVGDKRGKIEIWDIVNKKAIKTIDIGCRAMTSSNNILAVSGCEKQLRLYDVTSWECFYIEKIDTQTGSLHLTPDLKYLTISGIGGNESCTVLQIK